MVTGPSNGKIDYKNMDNKARTALWQWSPYMRISLNTITDLPFNTETKASAVSRPLLVRTTRNQNTGDDRCSGRTPKRSHQPSKSLKMLKVTWQQLCVEF